MSTITQTRQSHTMAFVTNCGSLTGTRNSSVDSPGGIDPMAHCTMGRHSNTVTVLHGVHLTLFNNFILICKSSR